MDSTTGRAWRITRLWLFGLVALWAVCVLATSSTDPAAPLATLLIVCGGSLLMLGAAVPAEDHGQLVRGQLPTHEAESEEWRLFAVGMLAFGGVAMLAAGAWWALWQLSGEPRVFLWRALAVAVLTLAAAYLLAIVAMAGAASRKSERLKVVLTLRDRLSPALSEASDSIRSLEARMSRRDLLEAGGMRRHRIRARS
jgi:hypothetical protein